MTKRYVELSSRERQILDIVCRRGAATVAEVRDDLPKAPSLSAVRTMLARLEEKGRIRRRMEEARNVYRPAESLEELRGSALDRVMHTFFQSSPVAATAAILDRANPISSEELDELAALVEAARKREETK